MQRPRQMAKHCPHALAVRHDARQGASLARNPVEFRCNACRSRAAQRLSPQSHLVMGDDIVDLTQVPFRLDLLPEAARGGSGIAVEHRH